MTVEIILLIAILVALAVLVILMALLVRAVSAVKSYDPNNEALIAVMAAQVAAVSLEFFPKSGATMSYQIIELGANAKEGRLADTSRKAENEEARNTARSAAESIARLSQTLAVMQAGIENMSVEQQRQAAVTLAMADRIATNVINNETGGLRMSGGKLKAERDVMGGGKETGRDEVTKP